MSEFERGREALRALAERLGDVDLNEATTRRNIIDGLLKDVLGWPDGQVSCEEHVEGDYTDYTLGAPHARVVLEAKRTGRTFEMPAGSTSGTTDLSTVRAYSTSNKDAVDQVLGYCQKSGVGIAVLSNGYQLLLFLGSRSDGQRPTQGRAIYYASLEDMLNVAHELWDFLSYPGVQRGDLVRALSARVATLPPPPPLSSRISSYPGYRIGSEMETDLRILGDLFIQDVVREETITDEFLTQCYCSSGALSQYAVVSKEILRTRYQVLSGVVNTESARDRRGPNSKLTDDVIAGAITRRPIVLVGDVGVGKSIFLKHLFRVDAKDILDRTIVFYVDFLKHSGLVEDVSDYIVTTVSSVLRDDHDIDVQERGFVRAVYKKELADFGRGIYGELAETSPDAFRVREIEMLSGHLSDRYEHSRRALTYLQASRRMNFVIVLDNVDQHQPSFQDQIFIAGQSLADTWPISVFMSLRPDTFHESRRTGALAAYQPRVFTVSPPRSDLVITKRLEFARRELMEAGRLPGFPAGLTLDSQSLIIYIDVLLDAFANNEPLVELVDNLSSGNTRRALDFVSTFVGSGYVQTSRVLDAHKTGRPYVVPLHEFIRAILYGDHKYYDPHTSPVPNLFSVSSSDAKEHFLLPLLLATVQQAGERESGGFTDLRSTTGQLQALGYLPEQIEFGVERALAGLLLEVSDHADTGQLVRITPAGGYLHKKLASNFPYVDAVIVDTPILDPTTRGEIRDVFDIEDRILRAETFMRYLGECWPFGDDPLPFSWAMLAADWERSLATVRRGAERAAERRARR
ncbi:hypothetical protein QSU92_07715 [Microbacterium sp. ET2]|uniref:hypothetical protein n=1 Tax=Microbacterium albipurpureum TaxID=3050384 RepID=UPI00259CF352|nr:hypothetical protein [Microbacterium sp. ET2 (Ac-2212)]WJL97043.1 hypothetical protein QSU92_07715 [Microbacterium sp. ET2 (Ac-2212)]